MFDYFHQAVMLQAGATATDSFVSRHVFFDLQADSGNETSEADILPWARPGVEDRDGGKWVGTAHPARYNPRDCELDDRGHVLQATF